MSNRNKRIAILAILSFLVIAAGGYYQEMAIFYVGFAGVMVAILAGCDFFEIFSKKSQ